MNQFKDDVLRELQDVKLTDEKKHAIAQKVRRKSIPGRNGQWQYRIVLATFTLCAIAFSYVFSQDEENQTGSHQGAALKQEMDTSSFWTFLDYDLVRGLLLFSVFPIIALFITRYLKKKNYGLPVCIECGETWSHKQARKILWKNNMKPIECPHCGKKQYRTNKSIQLNGLLQLPMIQIFSFMNHNFHNIFIGIAFYIISTIIYYYQITPYLFALQENDPMKEPQKPLW